MVAAPAAADAVARARRLPGLRVGLHLVLVDGVAVLPPADIRGLVGPDGRFDDNQGRAGFRYFFAPGMRRRLAAEIRAQFEAFRATGLALDHVNAHKHMHLHPTVARLIVEIGRDYGMRAVRLPDEPVGGAAPRLSGRALPARRPMPPGRRRAAPAAAPRRAREQRSRLRHRLERRDDRGAAARPAAASAAGRQRNLFPPGDATTPALAAAMPGYRHADELAALLSPTVRRRIAELGHRADRLRRSRARRRASQAGLSRRDRQPVRRAEQRRQDEAACRTACRRARSSAIRPSRAVPGSFDSARLPKADIVVSALNTTARAVLDCR